VAFSLVSFFWPSKRKKLGCRAETRLLKTRRDSDTKQAFSMENIPPTLYGIKNCDTIKKARAYLDSKQVQYRFHDYRVDGIDTVLVQHFIDQLGIDAILNQRSTSWRQLTDEQKSDLSPEKVLQLLLEVPTLIKRPILDDGQQLLVGFTPELYSKLS
jgi:Spx/MgsR family transcriptional regulator